MPPLVFVALLAAQPAVLTLSAAERAPALVFVLTPFGSGSATGTSRFVEAMAEVLARRTDLRGQSPEQAGLNLTALTACPARSQLTCWTRLVRTQARRRQPHLTDPAPRRIAPRFVFSLAVRRIDDDRDRVVVSMLDTRVARDLDPQLSSDQREDIFFRRTPRSRPIVVDRNDLRDLKQQIEGLLVDHFADALAAAGHWQPFGRFRLTSPCEGCEVTVDDHLIGLSRIGPLQLDALRPGQRRIRLVEAGTVVLDCTVPILPARTVSDANALCTKGAERGSDPPLGFRYGGLASGVAGLALIAVGIVQAATGPGRVCLIPDPGDASQCDTLGSPGFGYDTDPGLTDDVDDVNPSGVPVVAVGASLVGLGATWAAGSWLWADWPWWGHLLLGVAVGGAGFGIGFVAAGAGR